MDLASTVGLPFFCLPRNGLSLQTACPVSWKPPQVALAAPCIWRNSPKPGEGPSNILLQAGNGSTEALTHHAVLSSVFQMLFLFPLKPSWLYPGMDTSHIIFLRDHERQRSTPATVASNPALNPLCRDKESWAAPVSVLGSHWGRVNRTRLWACVLLTSPEPCKGRGWEG